ncbi:hypothetical protein FKM82_014163 [Ascaphus truei]
MSYVWRSLFNPNLGVNFTHNNCVRGGGFCVPLGVAFLTLLVKLPHPSVRGEPTMRSIHMPVSSTGEVRGSLDMGLSTRVL